MSKIVIEKEKLKEIIQERIILMLECCKYHIDKRDLEILKDYILKDLEPYRIKERCEAM